MEKLKNRLNISGINTAVIKTVALHAVFFIIGFLFGGISFAGGISPFATGFAAGAPYTYLLSSAVGASVGYGVFFGIFDSLRFITAVFIICILRLGIDMKLEKSKAMISSALMALIITFAASFCVFLAVGEDSTFIIMSFCESLISCAFACFTVRALSVPKKAESKALINTADAVAAVFFASIALLSIDRFSLAGFSPARLTAYFCIMFFAFCGKEAASSVAGICSALTLGFNEEHPQLMAAFILSGISTGIAGIHGKIPIAMSLVLSNLLSVILRGAAETAVIAVTEAVVAGIVFVLIPKKILVLAAEAVAPLSRTTHTPDKSEALSFALKRSSKAIKDIASSVDAVTQFLGKNTVRAQKNLTETVKEDICKECTKYDFCWNKCADITKKAFNDANRVIHNNERILYDELPERISLICRMPEKLADSFNRAYFMHLARLVAESEIADAKKAAARSFYCVGTLIEDAAKTLNSSVRQDSMKEAALSAFFKEKGFQLKGISALINLSGKSTVQVYCDRVPLISDMASLLEEMYEVTGINYLSPVCDEYSKEGTVLSFCEEGKFSVEYHTASHTGANEQFSGDTARCFYDGTGYFYTVLSDGMGSGARAAVDSVMTCVLLSRLMRAGFSPENALDAVNCALLVKSAEETLSTLDIMRFELDTGKAEFFKAGAAFSVIKKAEKTLVVEKSSMPLGILSETAFEKSEINLSENDTVFIISDGAAVISPTLFKELIHSNKNADAKHLAEAAVKKALELSPIGKHDDITVTCIKIK